MSLKKVFVILLVIVSTLVLGCVGYTKTYNDSRPLQQTQVQPTDQPIEVELTKDVLASFCTQNNYTLVETFEYNDNSCREAGCKSYFSDGYSFSSSDTSVHHMCHRANVVTHNFTKGEVKDWLVSTGVVSQNRSLYNVTDVVYDTFCARYTGRLSSVNNDTIACSKEVLEEKEFSGQEIAKWYLRQNIKS